MPSTPPPFIRETADGVVLNVIVTPRAKKSAFMGFHDGLPKIALAAPPIEGRANDELIQFLKKLLKVPARQLELIRGDSSRRKSVLVRDIAPEAVLAAFEG